MRDTWREIRRFASLAMLSLCIASLIYLLLPKTLKSTATFALSLLAAVAGCLWFQERVIRRREEENTMEMIRDVEAIQSLKWAIPSHDHLSGQIEKSTAGEQPVFVKISHHGPRAIRHTSIWENLPRLWELFSFILPPKVHQEAFEPAFNNLKEKYLLSRKYRNKAARWWIALAFSALSLLMVLDCLRVLVQSGAVKTILSFLPDACRSWWRRQ